MQRWLVLLESWIVCSQTSTPLHGLSLVHGSMNTLHVYFKNYTGCLFLSESLLRWRHWFSDPYMEPCQPTSPTCCSAWRTWIHGGDYSPGGRRHSLCLQLVAAPSAIVLSSPQHCVCGTVCQLHWHRCRHCQTSTASWRLSCLNSRTPNLI